MPFQNYENKPSGKMMDRNTISLIGKAIREGKYLNITYKNKNGEITPFWICILDINANDELYVNIFNITKDEPILNAKIFIPNQYVKHYEFVRELINKFNGDVYQRTLFDGYDFTN
ncbi:MAG: hypothetical protein U0W24_08570 [Bacteroidales bacterium]